MAATNYTPIQLYYSTTASAAPTAGNLVNGELAINITDGKLYYKDNGGVVQVIATKGAGTIGGSNTQIQFNDGGALAGNAAMVFNKATNVTTLTTLNLTNALGATYGGTAQSAYAQGDLLYASAVNTLSKLSIGTVNYILTSTGSVPQWVAPTSVTVQTANNLAGGAAGSVPYQSAADTTTFLSIGAANRVMTSTGSAPQWVTSLTGLTGVSSSSITNTGLTSGRVVYSGASGVQTDSANLTFNGTTLSAGGFSTTGNSTLVKLVTIGDSSFTTAAVLGAATPAKLYIGTGAVTDGTSAGGATNTLGTITAFGQTQVIATNASVTYTNLATLYVAGAPTAGTNVTITNPYSLYIAGGTSYFGGGLLLNTLTASKPVFTDANKNLTSSGTLLTDQGGTGLSSYTAGDITYYASGTALTKLGIGTNGQILTSTGTAPQWSTLSGVAVTTFSAGTTGFTPSSATSGAITLAGTLATTNGGTGLTSFTANGVVYASSSSALATGSSLTFDGTTLATAGKFGITGNGSLPTATALQIGTNGVGSRWVYNAPSGGEHDFAINGVNIAYVSGTSFGTLNVDAIIYGVTVGRGGGAVSTNTALGVNALAASNSGAGRNTGLGYAAMAANTTGVNNTGVGQQALTSNQSGSDNVAVGYASLFLNLSGSTNVAVGVGSLQNTTASANTAVGYQSLTSNLSASYNTAVGYQAAFSNQTGGITAVGYQAGYAAVTASDLTYIGNSAGLYATGNLNTAVGVSAMRGAAGVSTGAGNTALGYAALYSNRDGVRNTSVGLSSLENNTSGNYNTAVGYQAIAGNTSASSSTAVGYQAGLYQSGGRNTSIGLGAGAGTSASNTTSQSTFIGFNAGVNIQSGSYLVLIGDSAGASNTTGSYNVAIGQNAMVTNQSGVSNVAIGAFALSSNLASRNTAVGYQAGYSVATNAYNAYLGYAAGFGNTGDSNVGVGDNALAAAGGAAACVAIGQAALSSTTGNYNTAIGYNSGSLITSGAKNTILGRFSGNQGPLDIRMADNYVVLSDGDGNPRMWANSAAWTNPGSMSVGGIITYASQSQSFSLGTTQWIRLCRLGNPGTMRIKYFLGSNNSEEYGEVLINATYNASGNQITVNRQSYNSHLLEVRLVAAGGSGYPYDVFFNIRSDQFAPSITWTPFDVRASSFTIYNDTTSPGAASSSLVLETGSGAASNIVATNGLYGAYGGGVQFPATQVASANANTLDDYEEGTWTPTLKDTNGGTANVAKYSQRGGRYRIIGDLIYIQFNIQLDGTSGANGTLSSAGGLQIGNLPFSGVTGLQMASLYLYSGWVGALIKGATTTYASGGNFTEIVNNGGNMNGGNVGNDFYMWGGMVATIS